MQTARRWIGRREAVLAVAAWIVMGCQEPVASDAFSSDRPAGDLTSTTSIIVRMTGVGEIGDGHPAGDSIWLQAFDLDAGTDLGVAYGRLDYVDYSVFKPDGKPARLYVGSDDPETAILGFIQTSERCVDVSGTGRIINTGELVRFLVEACDNGEPGVGRDVFGIYVPERFVTHGSPYQRGPDQLSDGELTRTLAS